MRVKERIANKMLSRFSSQGSMTAELYPEAEKFDGALRRYKSFWSSDNAKLRRLSRIVYFESPAASAILDRFVDLVVGSGLRLQAEPVWSQIGGKYGRDVNLQREWVKRTEKRYHSWAKSYAPGYAKKENWYQIDRKCFFNLLKDGEYFLLLRYAATGKKNPLTVQIIPPENIAGGDTPTNGNELVNGIEYDPAGRAVAYNIYDDKTGNTTRVPRFGSKSGRVFMVHNFLAIDDKQRRGVPYLANCIHEFTKLGDYEVLELQAAIVNALFAVWVEPPVNEDGVPTVGAGAQLKSAAQVEGADTSKVTDEYVDKFSSVDYSKGGMILDGLPAGHKVQSFDTKRPNAGFSNFFDAVKKNIFSSRSMAKSAADLEFNASYSGARGELLILWMAVDRFRDNHGWDLDDDIYKMWLYGEIDRAKIDAPGFYDDEETRNFWAGARWIGNPLPNIDPLKLVNAHEKEQKLGYKTGHQITAERGGGDYQENLAIIKDELAQIAAANEPLERIKQAQPNTGAGGDNHDDEDDGDEEDDK